MPIDNPKTRSRSGPMAALVLVGLLLYVLSIGPVELLIVNHHLPNGAIDFYRPPFALAGRFPPVDKSLVWYIRLWTGSTWTEPGHEGFYKWTRVLEH